MSDTFFGFDTSLPALEDVELLKQPFDEEKDETTVDEKNEETFGGSIDADDVLPPRSEFSSSQKPKGKRMSIKDILTQEYIKSSEVVSFEEEMEEEEIIENSISQLGLDDDADEKHVTSQLLVDDNASWTLPPPGTPQRELLKSGSLIQDILSPDKRGIWTSPDRGDPAVMRSMYQGSEDRQPDLLKQLFHSASRNLPNDANTSRSANVIKAEDLEKNLPYNLRPVIIERKMPRTAPPGFPLPIGTPPSGLPWMHPPGVMPFSPMMPMPGHMQRMLPPSPYMGILSDLPNRMRFLRGRMPDQTNRMQGMQSTPTHMDRYQQGLGGSWSHRAQGGQQRRQWHNNDQYGDMRRQNFQGNQQRRQWNNYGSGNEDIMRLPPSEMMTSKEKEWLVKIQLMTLMTDDPKNTDYYYMNYLERKASNLATEKSEDEKLKDDADKENFNKLLDIVEQKREERKYRPVAFEGSLGKVTLANVHHPRKLMDVSSREQEEDDQTKSKTSEGMKKRFSIYGGIEQSFSILLDIEKINSQLLDVPDAESDSLVSERCTKIESLFNTMKLSAGNWQRENVNEMFVQMMCIPKGKRLFFRALRYFNKEQSRCTILSILSSLHVIAKKDAQTKILKPFVDILKTVLLQADSAFFVEILAALSSNKLSYLFLFSFCLEITCIIIESFHRHVKESTVVISKELQDHSDKMKSTVASSLSQISAKSRERHLIEITHLENLLQQSEMSHAVEE